MRKRQTLLGAVAGSATIAAAAIAGPDCWIQGGSVDCLSCTNQTGNTCNGEPCNTTVSIEYDVQTVTGGEPGKTSWSNSLAGTCTITYRTCVEGVCQESTGLGTCNNRNPSGSDCGGGGGGDD